MKKLLLVLIVCCSVLSANSQEQNDNPYAKNNEIKANGLYLVIGLFDFSYERLLNEESAVGINAVLPYDEDIKDDLQYYISPYYRFYFGNKYAAGFFIEGFGMLNASDREFDFFIEDNDREYVTDFALGIGLGGKWVTKGGFIGELNFGVGRNLFKSNETDLDFVSKFNIGVGYRF
ncbi:DUF3575 domain-containing protein [Winogradskyella flava]|uniref:DUF3575 domain-containing protein n=1 Tax=Winogradskyella flava TaxID=1884876 RepID=A0A842IS59_9FLAO|nr:DUF3575 domain-containing protein [Winogradskyella flava]MBC2844267.1 DUF3575 domain-containing protein [Winogradskyella flava]